MSGPDARIGGTTVGGLVDVLAAPAPSPAGGSAAAVAAALGSGLVRLVASVSPDWDEAPGVAAQAGALADRLLVLADDDVRAFAEALEALRTRRAGGDRELGAALARAADVPLAIAEAAADVAELAALAAEHGKPDVRPDAGAAAALAEAAAAVAADLVRVNLGTLDGDERATRASAAASAAAAARAVALARP